MPDIILTAGAFGREVMLRNGCRPETVEVCGPLRHHKLMMRQGQGCEQGDAPRSRLGIEADARVLVVATAVSKEEAEGLLAALRANVSDLKPFVVMFKSHPALSLDQKFLEVVGRLMEDSAYRILQSVDDLYDALAVAEAAVVNHSTVTIEAMVLGALPIVFDSGAVYDPKAMESDEYGGLMVSNVDELRKALHEAARQRGCREMLRERLVAQSTRWFDRSTLQPHQRLVEILERHGILSAQGVEAR